MESADREPLAIVYLSRRGGELAERLRQGLAAEGSRADLFTLSREDDNGAVSLAELTASLWGRYRSLVMIMATGIVVRVIAPLLENKWHDPAVVTVDEGGHFAVSLLSGHWGMANPLTKRVAGLIGAQAVVTTATDVRHLAAVDLLARQWGFLPEPRERVKLVAGALLRGERVSLRSEWDLSPWTDRLRGIETVPWAASTAGDAATIWVTSGRIAPFPRKGLYLTPRSLVAGIGCVREISCAEISDALEEALRRAGRRRSALRGLASHRIKSDEKGLLQAARQWGLPISFFDNQILNQVLEGNPALEDDPFVRTKLGVGGVCETTALAASRGGSLILPKTKLGRVTVALAEDSSLLSASGRVIRKI